MQKTEMKLSIDNVKELIEDALYHFYKNDFIYEILCDILE